MTSRAGEDEQNQTSRPASARKPGATRTVPDAGLEPRGPPASMNQVRENMAIRVRNGHLFPGMRFGHSFRSEFSPGALFEVHRDKLAEFGPRLNGVRQVRRRSEKVCGSVQHLEHDWKGDPAVLPRALRPFVPQRIFAWRDRTTWDAEARTGAWRVSVPGLGAMVRMQGIHRFEPTHGGTEVVIEGTLEVAVVEALGGSLAQNFVKGLFDDILSGSAGVIQTYLLEQTRTDTARGGGPDPYLPSESTDDPERAGEPGSYLPSESTDGALA